MKIQGLISDDITPLVDKQLQRLRREANLSDEDFDKLLSEEGEDIFAVLEEESADFLAAKFTLDEFRRQVQIANKNSQKILEQNEDFFQLYLAYVHTAHIVYENFLEKMGKPKEVDQKVVTHLLFYGNLCRMADQIGLQLSHGHPDAALRLWRSFYEHAVVAVLLMKTNLDDLDNRFRKATTRENKRAVESFTKRHQELKFPPLDDAIIQKAQQEYAETEEEYSKKFFSKNNAWAAPYINGNASFNDVEEATGMSRYRPFYIWSSSKVHPTYKGLSEFRDSTGATVLSFVTRQQIDRTSLIDPAQLTLNVFHVVNDYFLDLYAGHEYTINLLLFRKIYDRFGIVISEKGLDNKKSGVAEEEE